MADTKISALSAAAAAAATNELAINEAGTSKKVTAAQIAAYVSTPYKVALQGFVTMYSSLAAGTYSLVGYEAGANASASGVAGAIAVFRLTAAELAVAGLTTKLNVQAYIACSGTTPGAGWTATYGLYPVTSSGTTNLAFTAGTVVSGSTAAPAWAVNTIAVAASGDFTLPSDGAFGLYVVTNQALAASMVVRTGATVRFRNV